MNHQTLGVADVGKMGEQLQALYKALSRMQSRPEYRSS